MLAAETAASTGRPILTLLPSERQADLFAQDLGLFTDSEIIRYPGYDIPPYTPLSPDPTTVAARLAALYRTLTAGRPPIFVASCEALLRRVIPKQNLADLVELIINGEETDREGLIRRLADAGYESCAMVRNVGDFSVRGGLVDVFPPGLDHPVRLDFLGDTVESLRLFDPVSQRSVGQLSETILLPASNTLFPAPGSAASQALVDRCLEAASLLDWPEAAAEQILERLAGCRRFPGIEFFLPLFYPTPSTPFDYLAKDTLVVLVDPMDTSRMARLAWERIEANHHEAIVNGSPALPPPSLFLSEEQFDQALAEFDTLRLHDFASPDMADGKTISVQLGNHKLLKQEINLHRKTQGVLPPLTNRIATWLDQGDHVGFACRSARHARQLGELLIEHGLPVEAQEGPIHIHALQQDPARAVIALFDQPLSDGFDLPLDSAGRTLHLLAEGELFGEFRLGTRKKTDTHAPTALGSQLRFDELRQGDVVVHAEHGLGIFEGLIHLELQGVANDFLQIVYQGNDKLYVPVDRINGVNKYKGLSDKTPKIDRLGGKSWHLAKAKVKEAVWKVARELLEIYAKRELCQGHAFTLPCELYRELEESFPFDETPDQMRAINDVLDDLTSNKPMDRLVCGDVGYGKTEVAVRAAFKVVEDGYQAAVLVPTTVLAEQHTDTFRERLRNVAVRVECLNRFRSPAEQRRIIRDLRDGRIDIVIGTHRLLSKDVAFKRLGLLVVDEEHRFGVSHKEKIKRLRAEVDILTLTATPIPRTLEMSLLNIRDLSVISTPPEHRRKVLTFVARHDDLVIKEAVVRELQRGGQVFVVHNRVRSIHAKAQVIERLAPEARVGVAHGQMTGKNLEAVMVQFINKELDVLVCTTIIESGLDIASANTIIILRADQLGLAEIYQLRGRVGRSSEQSYAYLLVPSLDGLTRDARDRLRALLEHSDLGGGFRLAMSDLQIRGGGNLLGVSQSGHIAAVGYDLYLDLLQQTVADLKNRDAAEEAGIELLEPEINMQLSAFIPEHYIPDPDQRYLAYRKIAGVRERGELLDLQDELKDRYGTLPEETATLCAILDIKIVLRRLGIAKLDRGEDTLVFAFDEHTPVSPRAILAMTEAPKQRARFTPDSRLIVRMTRKENGSADAILQKTQEILQALAPAA